uniref:Uncharacterized protein n=1 Tax=Leersia perrieri TaxID=77586 RepID=A0A0D9XFF8_9ORYZ
MAVVAITSLDEAELAARELGGPHVDVHIESVVLNEAPAMAAILSPLFEEYGWRIGNIRRLLNLAGIDEHLSVVVDVHLPRLNSDVRDPNALALLRVSGTTIIRLARRVGGPSAADYVTFGNRITRLAHHIHQPRRNDGELRQRIGQAVVNVNQLKGARFDF